MSDHFLRRVYKFRAYPSKQQAQGLTRQLGFCCALYNAALEQRRMLWRDHRVSITHKQQSQQLTELRAAHPEWVPEGLSRSAMQKTLELLNHSFEAFYRRVQRRETAGFPRFKSHDRWNTLRAQYGRGCTFTPSADRKARLSWAGVGDLRVKQHRPLPENARVTEVQVKRVAGGGEWFVCLAFIMPASEPLCPTHESVGVDVGITTFAALSTGERIVGPRSYRRHERRLARLQRELARCERGSKRRQRKRSQLARAHARIGRARRDHAHKTARSLVARFDALYVEDLNVQGLARSTLAKHVKDQAWGMFFGILADKAEEAGRLLVKVDPRGSSQECSGCGATIAKTLAERIHSCACGLTLDRDVNAARVILRRGECQREAPAAVGHEPRRERTRNQPEFRAA